MDYVLLHELIHTRIKNHGAPFWDELNRLMDGARGIDHRLDDFRGLLGCP
jgi:predicted metal-dependent hydrolase